MKNISIWQDTVNNEDRYELLKENIDVDILIGSSTLKGAE